MASHLAEVLADTGLLISKIAASRDSKDETNTRPYENCLPSVCVVFAFDECLLLDPKPS